MKKVFAALSVFVLSLFTSSSCEDVELEVRASLDCRFNSSWEYYHEDHNGNPFVYEGFDSRVLHDNDIVFIFNDIVNEYGIFDYIKYAVLHVSNYNKLDGKYRYSDDYLFTWSDQAGTFVFKDVDDLTPEERANYPLP